MTALILVLAGVLVWLEVTAMKRMGRASLRSAQAAFDAPADCAIEERVAYAASEIAALLDLRACWFEPFPFDTLLPRIADAASAGASEVRAKSPGEALGNAVRRLVALRL